MNGTAFDGPVNNAELVQLVAIAAQTGAECVRGGLPRDQAAWMCWEFVRDCTRYWEETDPEAQTPRMPWRFVEDGVGDCKSQAIFISALCAASGCNVLLRFAVLPGDTEPGHVYAVVDNVPCDPLLEFGEECAYLRRTDIPITLS